MKKRRCAVCGSRQWHKEPSSGLITCSEGHVLKNYRNEATEAEEIGPHAIRKRKLKATAKKLGPKSRVNDNLYYGEKGNYHYFLCQQHLLRKQASALINLWKLPPEFEAVCRDVWALHLSLIPKDIPHPFYHEDEDSQLHREEILEKGDSEMLSRTGDDGKAEIGDMQNEEDPELAQLMRENSEYSSSSPEDEDEECKPLRDKPKKKRDHRLYDGPSSNIVVLMLSCWTLRIPILYRDFIRAIDSYELPYLDPVKHLPESMSMHLTRATIQSLSPFYAPGTLSLHLLVSRLAKHIHQKYNVYTPELNASPLLWRITKTLGGTPMLYSLAKRLSYILSLPLTLHSSLAPSLEQVKRSDPESHKYDNAPPEVSFLAVLMIILKMVYGLDGKTRIPSTADDPACILPRVKDYLLQVVEQDTVDDTISPQSTIPVGDMTDIEMDAYLEFCQKALVSERTVRDRILDNYFVIERSSPSMPSPLPRAELPKRQATQYIPREEEEAGNPLLRPGQDHSIYNARDILGDLPKDFEQVLSRGTRWIGVEEEYVLGAIENFERRLLRWWDRRNRRGKNEDGRIRGGDEEEEGNS